MMTSKQADLWQRIEGFDMDPPGVQFPFSARLARENGWTPIYTQRVIQEYKRFVFLMVSAGHPVTPSDQVDQVWHLHMTFTHSYWDDLCRDVIGGPLHHNPTEGGGQEREKFHDWYAATLDSYRHLFGQEPPVDIWHDARERFGDDIDFERVNVARHWVIAKRPVRQVGMALGLVVVVIMLTAWQTAGGFKPFDLNGPQFLTLFYGLLGGVLIVSWGMRRWMNRPAGVDGPVPDLDGYELAYLAGGERRAVDAAIVGLVHRGLVEAHPLEPSEFRRTVDPQYVVEQDLHRFERNMLDELKMESYLPVSMLRMFMQKRAARLGARLEEEGLLASRLARDVYRYVPVGLMVALIVFGGIKILVGISRGRPVGFLTTSCLLLGLAVVGLARGELHRSRDGSRVLKHYEGKHAALRSQRRMVEADAVALGVALYGFQVLTIGKLLEVAEGLKPPRVSVDESGGGCGGDGGGAAGCGGCGGCGGCAGA